MSTGEIHHRLGQQAKQSMKASEKLLSTLASITYMDAGEHVDQLSLKEADKALLDAFKAGMTRAKQIHTIERFKAFTTPDSVNKAIEQDRDSLTSIPE